MPNNITPTSRSPQEESKSTGIKSRNHSESSPTRATPAEWPTPHRSPGSQARRGRRTAGRNRLIDNITVDLQRHRRSGERRAGDHGFHAPRCSDGCGRGVGGIDRTVVRRGGDSRVDVDRIRERRRSSIPDRPTNLQPKTAADRIGVGIEEESCRDGADCVGASDASVGSDCGIGILGDRGWHRIQLLDDSACVKAHNLPLTTGQI